MELYKIRQRACISNRSYPDEGLCHETTHPSDLRTNQSRLRAPRCWQGPRKAIPVAASSGSDLPGQFVISMNAMVAPMAMRQATVGAVSPDGAAPADGATPRL